VSVFFKSNYAEVTDDIRQIMAAFRKLPATIAKKRLRQGMRKAIKPFLPALQSATPFDSGNLMRSAISIVRFYNKADHGAVAGVIGFSRKRKSKRRGHFTVSSAGFHSHLVEDGTRERTQKSTGRKCGRMPASHMVRETLAKYRGLILLGIEQELAKSLEKTAEDLRKK